MVVRMHTEILTNLHAALRGLIRWNSKTWPLNVTNSDQLLSMPARMLIRHSASVRICPFLAIAWIDPTLLKEFAVCGISACQGDEVHCLIACNSALGPIWRHTCVGVLIF